MSSETGEETLRYLVDKYIVKPALSETNFKLERNHTDDDFDSEDEAYVLRRTERVLTGVQSFICKNLDEARRLKIQVAMDL